MFRIGGSAEGITSGLAPRQGYANNNAYDQLVKQIPKIQEQAKKLSYKPRGTNVYDFLTEFGLDIASRSPVPGGILATAATSAKEPYQRFMQRKGEADVQKYASESDMFKTLIEGAATATGDEGVQWQKQWELQQIGSLMDEISGYKDIPVDERSQEQDQALAKAEEKLAKIKAKDPAVDWFLGTGADVGADKLFKKTKAELLNEDNATGGKKYKGNEDSPDLIADTFVAFKKYISELKAEGGRVGYANAGAVMPGQPMQAQAPGPTDQGETNQVNISYEQLRERLPQEISNEIVLLLSQSYEAFADFAEIQTQADVNEFNTKYNVQLFLPKQAGA